MSATAEIARDLRHALDPGAWARDVLNFSPDPWQAELLRSDARQVILCCSRQSGKSTCSAILAAHTALFRPGSLVLLVSKAQRQAAELLAKATAFLRQAPAAKLVSDNALSIELAGGSRIVSLPGDSSTIRGFSAPALVIEDEAAWVSDELYLSVRPMLAVSGGRLMLLSTPNGRRGHFFETWHGPAGWERYTVRAPDVPRITPEFLENERTTLGTWWFQQEYMCQFLDSDDQLFSSEAIAAAISEELTPLCL
jgi:Terminase large subunit, T4likevirus-type, N-terminal